MGLEKSSMNSQIDKQRLYREMNAIKNATSLEERVEMASARLGINPQHGYDLLYDRKPVEPVSEKYYRQKLRGTR